MWPRSSSTLACPPNAWPSSAIWTYSPARDGSRQLSSRTTATRLSTSLVAANASCVPQNISSDCQMLRQLVEAAFPALLVAFVAFAAGKLLVLEYHFRRSSSFKKFNCDKRFACLRIFLLVLRRSFPRPGEHQLLRRLHLAKDPLAKVHHAIGHFYFNGIAPARPHVELQIFRLVCRDVLAHPLL